MQRTVGWAILVWSIIRQETNAICEKHRFQRENSGAAPFSCKKKRSVIMSVPMSLMTGIVVGIVLFFILERNGVIYKWFDKWDQ